MIIFLMRQFLKSLQYYNIYGLCNRLYWSMLFISLTSEALSFLFSNLQDFIDDSFTSLSVSIWIVGFAHLLIFAGVR